MNSPPLLILCTCPDQTTANQIAQALVTRQLAACVNIVPGIRSIYLWQGTIESSEELLLLIKSTSDRFSKLQEAILSLHPYELPEVIAVPIDKGLPAYLNWITQCTSAKP